MSSVGAKLFKIKTKEMENNEEQNLENQNSINLNKEQNTQNEFHSRIDMIELRESLNKVKTEIAKVIVGQENMVEHLLAALLSNGHVLIEGVPGVAKTITAKLLAKTIDVDFSRIQFTPDLMPSDILGTSVFSMKNSEFEFKKGPIFSSFILIDEINRSPAKTQAALFEVMEEKQITIDGTRYEMDEPFLVIATQNPIEHEGTYRLPEAQLDRFLFKINVGYPNLEQEVAIIKNQHDNRLEDKTEAVNKVITAQQLNNYQKLVKEIIVESQLIEYIAKIIINTRENQFLYLGASPRASLALLTASKAFAALRGRDFVTPEDIKEASYAVLRHRVIVSPEREMEGLTADEIIRQILEGIEIPR
jgi:MoxR-like ATPase